MRETKNDIEALRSRIKSSDATPRAVVESSVNAAEKLNDPLNAFLEIDRNGALKRADSLAGHRGALAGIPMAIKDNIDRKSVV